MIHTHMSRANFFGVLLRRFSGIPCVATANNRYIQLHWMFNDRVLAASEATRRFHIRWNRVRRGKIDVIYNFIDAAVRVREELEIDRDASLVLVVGNLIRRKGIIHLVEALTEIQQHVPGVQVVSVGHPHAEYEREVIARAKQLGVDKRFHHIGPRDDIPALLAAADLFALPTLEDNLPLAVLEAMAAGLPIVATRVGGIPEAVQHGHNGLLVPRRAPHDLAKAVVHILGDPQVRRGMGRAGRERLQSCFSKDVQIGQLEQALQSVCPARGFRAAG